jgi:predicted branched-subunit amino acid permease
MARVGHSPARPSAPARKLETEKDRSTPMPGPRSSDPETDGGRRQAFVLGVTDAFLLPVWVILAGMTGFGSLARESGLGLGVALASTAGIWSLPGQVAFAELYAAGASLTVIVVAISMANVRFLPLVLSLMPLVRSRPGMKAWHFAAAQCISVNIWAGTMRRGPSLPVAQRPPYFWGYVTAGMASALIGTAIGFALAGVLPRIVTLGLVFLNPVYFTLVFIDARQRAGVLAFIVGAALGPAFYIVAPDWGLVATGIVAGTFAYCADCFWAKTEGHSRG